MGLLLEHTVGNLDPLYIVNMVPNGLEIPRLVLTITRMVFTLFMSSFNQWWNYMLPEFLNIFRQNNVLIIVSSAFRLRDRLVKIVTDYRTETSLRHGCNDILKVQI